jgi:exopolysaccharide biosynthesis polyprenyl glycosylphosphotransferase
MSTMDVQVENQMWSLSPGLSDDPMWSSAQSRLKAHVPSMAAAALAVVDGVMVAGALLLAYWVRFSGAQDTLPAVGFDDYTRLTLLAAGLTIISLATHGLYQVQHPRPWSRRMRSILSSVSTALVLSLAVAYYVGDQSVSRLWLASGWLAAVVVLVAWRVIATRLYVAVREALAPSSRVLIVGANKLGRQIAEELGDRYDVVGYVDNGSDLFADDLPLLGPIAELERLVHVYSVDELVIALPASRREQVNRLITRGFHRRVQVKLVPELGHLLPGRLEVQQFGGRHYIGFAAAASVGWTKRILDVALVILGLVPLLPLIAVVAIAIKLDSPGPVFYRQQRVGKDGRRFWMLKFRSMCQDADRRLATLRQRNEAIGPLFKMRMDPRITRVGRILRRLSLDELPQLLNVLKGEMSLVGPRPPIPSEVAEYADWQHGRLRAVPGITGLWQVSGRSEVPFHDMVRLDLHYIRNWSLSLDIEILLRTIPAVLTSRGAY